METKAQKYHALIEDELLDVKDMGDQYVVAQWNEADADAGYLIHIDGRMAPLGDYQFGFHHVNELISTPDVKEAIHELAKIASHLEQYDAADQGETASLFSENLGPSFAGPCAAYKAGVLSFDQLFDLASAPIQRLTIDGVIQANRWATIQSDVLVDVITGQGAAWQWSQVTVAKAGDLVQVSSSNMLSTIHGLVQLEPQECVIAPLPKKASHP